MENGPFIFKPKDHNLFMNDKSWNKRANVLYLELPAGAGYSVGSNQTVINDQITIDDAIVAMRVFFVRFPALKKNKIFISGSGYGATLATYIAEEMIETNKDPFSIFFDKFNIQGVLLGIY